MLNRSNRTLSANSNRLNLGTRSNALSGANMDLQALRIRHVHSVHGTRTVREEVEVGVGVPIELIMGYPSPTPISGSSSLLPGCFRSFGGPARFVLMADAPPLGRSVVFDDRACRAGRNRDRKAGFPVTTDADWTSSTPESGKPGSGDSKPGWRGWQAQGQGSAPLAAIARMSLAAVAAPRAATGG